jgi:uncharacterized protein (DUF1330 family)
MPASHPGGKTMPVYLIAGIQIQDPQRYTRYAAQAQEIVARHGGRYLFRGGIITPLAGHWQPGRMVVIAFETNEQLHACLTSAEYRAIAPLREDATTSRSIIVEGYVPDAQVRL